MLKGIIFDMDGVLINSEPVHYRVWKQALAARGIELDHEIYKPCIGSTNGFLMDILHDNYGISRDDKELVETMEQIKKKVIAEEGFPMIKGVPQLLGRLKDSGYRLAIASSSPPAYIRQVVTSLGIDGYFELLVSGEQVKNPKPAPDVFLEAARQMKLDPEECLILEDSSNGCRAAKAAGMVCCAYFNPDSGKQDLSPADVVIEGYEEIDGAFLEKVYCHGRHLPALVCETKRLRIREMTEQDIPKMMEITSQGTPDTAEGMAKSLEEELEAFPSYRKYMYEMCDMGYWVLEEKESGMIVGRAGVEPKIWNHNSSVVELGYLIDEKHRGKGFAYEACRGILEEAKRRGAVYLYCRIRSANLASKKLARKLGFSKIDYRLEDDSEDMEVYRYTCSE
ncbi:GNAT family N-acetyltransferase [Blautia pseudococcoides]|uniref:Haloacid dehalogenase n=1 Tax=Blautia pseudococcoides TaxID=1796616 RepID=A0A1C7I9C0_9FIRM|nr:GNAT family N-acetyltransferase [Blautia pseudococcoides]ANU76257.1 haloacid dehalogenase [Blautia pseudococcoides]ASU29067.1 haloacid dehalogenase [Blautia pseudococcoides]QQQ93832.1 GNAT family N-acetyltransferase [Blautia pseudococcoides]